MIGMLRGTVVVVAGAMNERRGAPAWQLMRNTVSANFTYNVTVSQLSYESVFFPLPSSPGWPCGPVPRSSVTTRPRQTLFFFLGCVEPYVPHWQLALTGLYHPSFAPLCLPLSLLPRSSKQGKASHLPNASRLSGNKKS